MSLGAGCRGFKSLHSDHKNRIGKPFFGYQCGFFFVVPNTPKIALTLSEKKYPIYQEGYHYTPWYNPTSTNGYLYL